MNNQVKLFWVVVAPERFITTMKSGVNLLHQNWVRCDMRYDQIHCSGADQQQRWRLTPFGVNGPLTTVQLAQVNGFIDGWIKAHLSTMRQMGMAEQVVVVE